VWLDRHKFLILRAVHITVTLLPVPLLSRVAKVWSCVGERICPAHGAL